MDLVAPFARLPQPFGCPDLALVGVTKGVRRQGLRTGAITTVTRGLYAVSSPWFALSPWERHRHMSEAAARLSPDAIVSHASAAALLDLPHPAYPPKRVAMTLLHDARTSRSDSWRQFHRGRTPPEHIVIRHGVPSLTVARVVIDSARELHSRDALAITDGALRAGLTTPDEILDMRRHQKHWPAVASSNDVLLLADPRNENWLESASAWSMSKWEMPMGVPQVNVFTPEGQFVGRVDRLWPEYGLVGEADGIQKYLIDGATEEAVNAALAREKSREVDMTTLGLAFIRWTPKEAIDGSEINARFRRVADPDRAGRVRAIFRCACCNHPVAECLVEASLRAWRAVLNREFERRVW